MKKIICILLVFVSVVAFSQTTAGLVFETKVGDYGDVKYGAPAEYEFFFTNTSDKDIAINNVKSNTRSIKFIVKDSIVKPGQRSSIIVIYNTDEVGPIRKTVTVFNTAEPSLHTLSIRGRVIEKS